jgi:hypothetical protein
MKITFGNGLNADALPSELGEGFVSSCVNMRFRAGFAEVVGGISGTLCNFSNSPAWLAQLYTSSDTYIVGVGDTTRTAEAHTLGGATSPDDITPKTEGVSISSATAAGTTVTITTASNHGRSTGNIISAWGFTPSEYNVESASITVTGVTTFTYTVPSAPAVSPATEVGIYSRDSVTTNLTANGVITGGEYNGLLIINSMADGCYYWAGDTSIPLRRIKSSYRARSAVGFGNFIVQFCPLIAGTRYESRICWSTSAEPGAVPTTFTASTTNQAGDVDKPEIGDIVYAKPLGDDLIVYGTKGRLVMRYVGGNDVFSFTKLPGDEGLYSTTTIAEFPGGHLFVDSNRRVQVHGGGVCSDVGVGRIQSILSDDGVTISWVVCHPRQSEIWIGFKSGLSVLASTEALIWNYNEKTWGKTSASNQKYAINATPTTTGAKQKLLLVGNAGVLTEYDNNEDYASRSIGTLYRKGLDAGDPDTIKNLQRSRWNVDTVTELTPTYAVQHGSSMFADTEPTYKTEVAYTVGTTDYVNSRATGGRFMAVAFIARPDPVGPASAPYYGIRVRSADLDFTTGGKR